jgi:antitoxin component YwqK of YwqJK toxin-antitoxin module
MKKTLFGILILLMSCNNAKYIEDFYPDNTLKLRIQVNEQNIPDGKYTEYYNSGEIKVVGNNKKGVLIDTVFHYHKNQKLREKGLIRNKLRFGWWISFDSLGYLKNKSEYLNIKGKLHKNQTIDFDRKGDTLFKTSSFFNLYIQDTLKLGKNIGKISYNSNFQTKHKFIYILIDNQISDN